MTGSLVVLKKSLLAVLAMTMLVVSTVVPMLDAGAMGVGPHFDGPQEQSCPFYGHNHAVCVVAASTPVMVPAVRQPELGRSGPIASHVPESDLDPARIHARVVRSRAPPLA